METLWPQTSAARVLSADSLDVWAVRLSEGSADREYRAMLSADELERAARFRLDEPRTRFVETRVALRCLLGRLLNLRPANVPLNTDASNKPQLGGDAQSSGLYFNVAHSGELALIALSRAGEVGVDVEQVRSVEHAEQFARKYFHAQEWEAIAAAEPENRDATFLHYWTSKEAVLKAVGAGITGSLSHFSVSADTRTGTWIDLPAARCWLHSLNPANGYAAAVACVNASPNVCCFELALDLANGDRD